MNIEFNGDRPLFTAFHTVRQGVVFSYKGDYYIRIETIISGSFIEDKILINAIRLSDGTVKHIDNHEQVLIVPAKVVIN